MCLSEVLKGLKLGRCLNEMLAEVDYALAGAERCHKFSTDQGFLRIVSSTMTEYEQGNFSDRRTKKTKGNT